MTVTKQNSQKNKFLSYLIDSAKCSAVGIIATVFIMFIVSFAITNVLKHEKFYSLIAVICQCIPSFISCRMIGKKIAHSLIVLGILQSISIFVFYVLISIILTGADTNYSIAVNSLPYVISSGVIGSITSATKQKKRRHS